MAKTISYLDSLKFNPNLRNSWQAKYIGQVRLVILLIIAIIIIGLFGYLNLPRRLNPEIQIPIVVVNTILPGASPEDVESLITIPIENELENIDGIDTMTSISQESASVFTIQFLSTVDGDKARDDVQSAVDSVADLPEDAQNPVVQKLDFEDQPVWEFALTTTGDSASLQRFSENLQKQIEELSRVDRVVMAGTDQQVIEVSIDPAKTREYNLNPALLSQTIRRAISAYPAGNIQTQGLSFALTIDKEVVAIDDIRNLRITVGTTSLRLGDIATIAYRPEPNQRASYFASSSIPAQPTVQFFVYKTPTANIDAAEQQAHELVTEVLNHQPQFQLHTITNTAEEITDQFQELTRDFLFTVLLVFTLLLIFLGFKQAAISSLTVPLTFLSAFAIINFLGLSLNFLTMFAFLLALGLLIDDTIVTVAAMTRYYATGRFTPLETGILVWKDFFVPLWSTTITTIWAFLPLLLASGIIGEFIKSIPIVVTATMLSSTTIAVLITLPLMVVFLRPRFPRRVNILLGILLLVGIAGTAAFFLPRNIVAPFVVIAFIIFGLLVFRIRSALRSSVSEQLDRVPVLRHTPGFIQRITNQGLVDIERLSHRYMGVIDRIILSRHGKRNTLIAIILFAVVAYSLIPLGVVKNEFFPSQDSNILYVNGELPAGTNIGQTNSVTLDVLEQVKNTPEVLFATAESGSSFSAEMGRSGASNGFLITLHLTEIEDREITSQEIAQNLRQQLSGYQRATLTVQELSGGPPAGADVQITLLGEDLTTLDQLADKVVGFLRTQQGVVNPQKSLKAGTSKLVFTPDQDALAENGLTVDAIALWMRTYASGFTLETVTFEQEEEDIIFRFRGTDQAAQDLGSLSIPTQRGAVPLLSLGSIALANNPTVITREEGKRSLTISGDVVEGFNIQEKNQALTQFVQGELALPQGYTWKTGGVNEENQRSVNSILQAMGLSFLLILITMVIEFRSFRQTFIALMIIPLSIAGVFYLFALFRIPLSFPALIGILALFGIVVTHAIVVIEKINDNIREGLPLRDAIVDAAGSRLEPVLLTSLATIAGLVPITISDPLWRGLGGAIIAGLLFSGAIKLFFVPVTYYLFYQHDTTRTQPSKTP